MVDIPLKDFPYYLDDLAKNQLPYGCSLTLNAVSGEIGIRLASQVMRKFRRTASPQAFRYTRSHEFTKHGSPQSINKNIPASFVTIQSNKKQGLDNMVAYLGNSSWAVSQQIETGPQLRRPKKSRYLWVPIPRRRKGVTQKSMRPKKGSNTFYNRSRRDGRIYLFKRTNQRNELWRARQTGNYYKIVPLFQRREVQTIKPVVDFKKTVENMASKAAEKHFSRCMDRALSTAK